LSNILNDSSIHLNSDYLVASMHEQDTLLTVLKKIPHKLFLNKLFVVYWDDKQELFETVNRDQIPYVELGSI
jgi:hypothetical protein